MGRRGGAIGRRSRHLASAVGADPQAVADLVDLIVAAGADPVVEHGVLTGEVAGLEVLARWSSIPTRGS